MTIQTVSASGRRYGQGTSRMLCPNSYGYNVMQLTLVVKFQLWLQENDHVICDRSLIYGLHWFYLGINYWWETTWKKKQFHFVRMDINKIIRPGNYKIHRQDFRASKENIRPIWCLLIHFQKVLLYFSTKWIPLKL